MDDAAISTFEKRIKDRVNARNRSIMDVVERQTASLAAMCDQMPDHFSFSDVDDIRVLQNNYLRAILASTAVKHVSLSLSLIESVNKSDFLSYALSARSIVEAVATLRYLLLSKLGPIISRMVQSGEYDGLHVKELIERENTYLRGTRFDWIEFFENGFQPLNERYADWLIDKKKNKQAKKWKPGRTVLEQFSVSTCLEKWAGQEPGVGVLYDLLCDMVHPNIGSVMATMVCDDEKVRFKIRDSDSQGFRLFELSFPALATLAWPELTKLLKILPSLYLPLTDSH